MCGFASDGAFVFFTRADAHDVFERAHEDLSVADLAGARGSKNSFNHGVNRVVSDGDVDADFGKKVDDLFRAAVELRMAATAEALAFRNGEAVNAGGGKGLADVVELEGLDDDGDELHEKGLLMLSTESKGSGRHRL